MNQIVPIDHDQRLKVAIKEFFPDFLRAFFPDWHRILDPSRVTWLDKEIFYHPPDGDQGILDLLAQTDLRQPDPNAPSQHIMHIEVQSGDSVAILRPRMSAYWSHLRKEHKLPVVSVALYLHVALKGRGRDHYQDVVPHGNRLRFEWPYMALAGLDGKRSGRSRNLLAAAFSALMRIPEADKAKHLTDLLNKIARSQESQYRKYLLTELAQTYLILNDEQKAEFRLLLDVPKYRKVKTMGLTFFEEGMEEGVKKGRQEMAQKLEASKQTFFEEGMEEGLKRGKAMNQTFFEKGIEKGVEQGIEKGVEQGQLELSRRMVLTGLDKRGSLTPEIRRQVESMSLEQLYGIVLGLLDPSKTLADLGFTGSNGSNGRNGTNH